MTRTAVCIALGEAASPAEVDRVHHGLLYLMGYDVRLRGIDPARAREEATSAVVTFVERYSLAPPGGRRALRPALGRRPRARARRHAARPPRRAAGSWCSPPPARSVEERWHPPHGRHNLVVRHPRPAHVRRAPSVAARASWPGPSSGPSSRKALLDRSGGNPFFLEELVTLLADAGMVGADGPPRRADAGHRRAARHAPRPRRGPPRRPHRRRAARARRLRGARAPRPDDGDRGDGRQAPRASPTCARCSRRSRPRSCSSSAAPARARSGPSAPTSSARSPTARSPRPTGPAPTPASRRGWRPTRTATATPWSTASPTTTCAAAELIAELGPRRRAARRPHRAGPALARARRPPGPTRPRSRSSPSGSTPRACACSRASTAPRHRAFLTGRARALAGLARDRARARRRRRPPSTRAARRAPRVEPTSAGRCSCWPTSSRRSRAGPRRRSPSRRPARCSPSSATRPGEAEVLRLRGFAALFRHEYAAATGAARAGAGRLRGARRPARRGLGPPEPGLVRLLLRPGRGGRGAAAQGGRHLRGDRRPGRAALGARPARLDPLPAGPLRRGRRDGRGDPHRRPARRRPLGASA